MRLEDIQAAIRGDDAHYPITRLIAIENTHNKIGGVAVTAEYTLALAEFAHARGLKLHVDGARVFNAAAALDVPVSALTGPADSATFCLSKALSAPVGSVLCGSRDFIKAAHRRRKVLGGGMRQAGILAAAGIVALEEMPQRLKDDHANARLLADGIARIPGLTPVGNVPTNMVYFDMDPGLPFDGHELCRRLERMRIKALLTGARRIRAVLHCWISREDVLETLRALDTAVKDGDKMTSSGAKVGSY